MILQSINLNSIDPVFLFVRETNGLSRNLDKVNSRSFQLSCGLIAYEILYKNKIEMKLEYSSLGKPFLKNSGSKVISHSVSWLKDVQFVVYCRPSFDISIDVERILPQTLCIPVLTSKVLNAVSSIKNMINVESLSIVTTCLFCIAECIGKISGLGVNMDFSNLSVFLATTTIKIPVCMIDSNYSQFDFQNLKSYALSVNLNDNEAEDLGFISVLSSNGAHILSKLEDLENLEVLTIAPLRTRGFIKYHNGFILCVLMLIVNNSV